MRGDLKIFLWSSLFCIVAEAIVFWCGIICVYTFSLQLGIKHRILGILCGLIPIVNLIMLRKIVKKVFEEVEFEAQKERVNFERKNRQVCKTKYPLLMVHGVFFRDFKYFNYWGRIPKELKKNGAVIYYGNHQSASSVEGSAKELACRIKEIINETGAEKLNIIAHSKGGLDCKKAIMDLDISQYVASLTTVNTPHRGCKFAEYLLDNIPEETQNTIAVAYNKALKKVGDENPDFLAAVGDLKKTSSFEDSPEKFKGIYCQSVGSVLKKARGGKFPLNFSYHFVKHFDGNNDGLVSEDSFEWGEKYTLLTPSGSYGISHGDMIDLHRVNVEGFDVREFYVTLVNDLKQRGL
jgi:triacylglycerol lipase